MFTLWESIDALKRFAGEDYETAVFYAQDERFLIRAQGSYKQIEPAPAEALPPALADHYLALKARGLTAALTAALAPTLTSIREAASAAICAQESAWQNRNGWP